VKRPEFEAKVLELWLKSQVTLTPAHVQFYSGATRKEVNKWLDELTVEGVLDVEVNNDGEMIWSVPGATRNPNGAKSLAEFEKFSKMKAEAKEKLRKKGSNDGLEDLGEQLIVSQSTAMAKKLKKEIVTKDGDKSVLMSGALSLLGPFGWLYAGSFKESIPAALAWLLFLKIMPGFLLFPLLAVMLPASALAGVVYAWQHNKTGERPTLFLGGKDDEEDE
jgi:hypothetical protein